MLTLAPEENGQISMEEVQKILHECKKNGIVIPHKFETASFFSTEKVFSVYGEHNFYYASSAIESFLYGIIFSRKIPVEIPKDQFDILKEVINSNIIVKGTYTYRQAKNLAKINRIAALKYNSVDNVVTSNEPAGISFYISHANSKWNGISDSDSIKFAFGEIAQDGGNSAVSQLISIYINKTRHIPKGPILNEIKVATHCSNMGHLKLERMTSTALSKALPNGAVLNNASKLLRSNTITAIATTAAVTAPDFYRALISQSISWGQFGKNLTINAAGVAGGTGGWIAGSAAGAAVGSAVPVIGTALGALAGGIIGAFTAGTVSTSATKAVLDGFIKEDAEEMLELVNNASAELCYDYLFSEQEIEAFIDKIKTVITASWLRDMYAVSKSNITRQEWAYNNFEPIFETISRTRMYIATPTDEVIFDVIGNLLKDNKIHTPLQSIVTSPLERILLRILQEEDKCCKSSDLESKTNTPHLEVIKALNSLSQNELIEILTRENQWVYIITDKGRTYIQEYL